MKATQPGDTPSHADPSSVVKTGKIGKPKPQADELSMFFEKLAHLLPRCECPQEGAALSEGAGPTPVPCVGGPASGPSLNDNEKCGGFGGNDKIGCNVLDKSEIIKQNSEKYCKCIDQNVEVNKNDGLKIETNGLCNESNVNIVSVINSNKKNIINTINGICPRCNCVLKSLPKHNKPKTWKATKRTKHTRTNKYLRRRGTQTHTSKNNSQNVQTQTDIIHNTQNTVSNYTNQNADHSLTTSEPQNSSVSLGSETSENRLQLVQSVIDYIGGLQQLLDNDSHRRDMEILEFETSGITLAV